MNDENICNQTEEETAAILAMSRDDEGCETDVSVINFGSSSEKTTKRAAEIAERLPKSSAGEGFKATTGLNKTTNLQKKEI